MSLPTIITFHADLSGSRYKTKAKHLKQRCSKLNVELMVSDETNNVRNYINYLKQECPKLKSRRNRVVRWIPTFIKTQLHHLNHPILWVHCDVTIRHRPPSSAFNDLSVGFSRGVGKYNPKVGIRNYKILGCPVYMKPDSTAFHFLDKWIDYCNHANCEKGEHYWLQNLCEEFSCQDGIGQLPDNFASKDPKSNVCFLI